MRVTSHRRPPFLTAAQVRRGEGRRHAYVDPTCDFIAVKPLAVGGVPVPAGTAFDKTRVTERTLRNLYEARSIALAPGSRPAGASTPVRAVGPTDLLHPGQARPAERPTPVPRRPRVSRTERSAAPAAG